MFDVGFSEIAVIAVVALVVIGPERLPRVARMAGRMLGQLQRYVNSVKSEIDREIQLDELKKLQGELNTAAQSLETSLRAGVKTVEDETRGMQNEFASSAAEVKGLAQDAAAAPAAAESLSTAPSEPMMTPTISPAAYPRALEDDPR